MGGHWGTRGCLTSRSECAEKGRHQSEHGCTWKDAERDLVGRDPDIRTIGAHMSDEGMSKKAVFHVDTDTQSLTCNCTWKKIKAGALRGES